MRYEHCRRRRASPELVVLDDTDEDEAGPSHQYRCSNDGTGCGAPRLGGDDDDDGGDYTQFYCHFGM